MVITSCKIRVSSTCLKKVMFALLVTGAKNINSSGSVEEDDLKIIDGKPEVVPKRIGLSFHIREDLIPKFEELSGVRTLGFYEDINLKPRPMHNHKPKSRAFGRKYIGRKG